MRRARVTALGLPHHITQRGNRRVDVFLDAEDRHLYLELLREYSHYYGLLVWAYSLMTNHTHLIAVPETEFALSKSMRATHGTYATMFNRKYNITGHLWQARFYSCVLDDTHLRHGVRYVERNPVRAGIVRRAEDYPWSSAAPHVLGCDDRYLDNGLRQVLSVDDWSAWLAGEDEEEAARMIRQATSTGRICGSEQFIADIESKTSRSLRPKRPGRPRKAGLLTADPLLFAEGRDSR